MSHQSFPIRKSIGSIWGPLHRRIPPGVHDATTRPPLASALAPGLPARRERAKKTATLPFDRVSKACYALRVRSNPETEDGVRAGDVIVVKKQESIGSGQSVVASINGEPVTLRTFHLDNAGIHLQPANPASSPIHLRHQDVQVLGIVTGMIRQP